MQCCGGENILYVIGLGYLQSTAELWGVLGVVALTATAIVWLLGRVKTAVLVILITTAAVIVPDLYAWPIVCLLYTSPSPRDS